jgi:hypothetical protein
LPLVHINYAVRSIFDFKKALLEYQEEETPENEDRIFLE